MPGIRRVVGALCLAVLAPAVAYGQASIAGVVRDASGAVLPGVTVEAASPVLIERTRTTVTDGSGQYRIIDLRGGTYTVTFTLSGFSSVRLDGVQLAGESVTVVNSEMRVGALQETITVTADAPTVDVQTTTRQTVMSKEVIGTLPTGRNYSSFGALLTGVSTNSSDAGGAVGDPMASLTVHGSRPGDQRVLQNGVNTMTLQAGGDIGIAVPNPGMAAEVTVDTSAVSAEQSQGGVRINYIPRDGGNQFSGATFVAFSGSGLQGDNLTDDLKAKGLTSVNSIRNLWDVNPGLGGPVRRDRAWFYFTGRVNRADQYAANSYANLNAYNTRTFTYVPDLTRPGYNANLWTDAQLRVTTQVTRKNKVAFTWDQQTRCSCPGDTKRAPWTISATTSPEASGNFRSPTQRLLHAEWSSPVTNNLLLEGLATHRTERWGFMHPTSTAADDFISPQEEAILTSGQLVPVLDTFTGRFSHGNFLGYNNNWVPNYFFRASAAYVRSGHQIKVGFSDVVGFLESRHYEFSPYSVLLITPPGTPVYLIRQAVTPRFYKADQHYDLGIFAQDRWTANRLTLTLGVRFDAYKAGSPAQDVQGVTSLTPTRPDIHFAKETWVSWKDVTPRIGATYDLAGDGKTAVRVSLNKYLQSQTVGPLAGFGVGPGGRHPVNRNVNIATRLWIDADHDLTPDCDLATLGANAECSPVDLPNFGQNDPNAARYSDELSFGWGKRGYNWEFAAGVQREIFPRVSVDVGYYRRWYGNFIVTDNTNLAASDFTTYNVTVPSTNGLSTSGQTVTGLFDPNKVVPVANLTTLASEYGKQIDRWNGIDASINARLTNGIFLFGGFSTGKTTIDNCEIAAKVPESMTVTPFASQQPVSTPLQFCHTESPFLTQVNLNGSYTIPKIDVGVSATFQSLPGPPIRAELTVLQRAPGVPLVGSTTQLVAVAPGANNSNDSPLPIAGEYGDRANQVDLRMSKLFRFGRTRTSFNVDLFNLFNTSTVVRENPNFNAYRSPLEIIQARYVKFGAQFDF